MTFFKFYNQFSSRLTDRSKKVLERGSMYANTEKDKELKFIHIIKAISEEDGSIGYKMLEDFSIRATHQKKLSNKAIRKDQIIISAHLEPAILKAFHIAFKYNQRFVGTEHLLYGIASTCNIPGITKKKQDTLVKGLEDIIESSSSLGIFKLAKKTNTSMTSSHHHTSYSKKNKKSFPVKLQSVKISDFPILDRFCENITQMADRGGLDPLIGREQELDRMIRILTRRTKNNPILVGEPGVGKTAIVYGLASLIQEGIVPAVLLKKKIYSLNLNNLVAGTTFRGEFEERMYKLTQEASNEDILLFIDEIHTLVGAGSAQGSLDAANILKPALANGDFQCIGATTIEEFKSSIEKDGALERRFQKILIEEEDSNKSFETLKNISYLYEKHHSVKIEENIIRLCVDLSQRYLPNRSLPDKAIDILDEAASRARSNSVNKDFIKSLSFLEKKLIQYLDDKKEAIFDEDYKKAESIKKKEDALKVKIDKQKKKSINKTIKVQDFDVYSVIAEMTAISIKSIKRSSINEMQDELKKYVIGQDDAVDAVVDALKRNYTGVRNMNRPVGSFLFYGESGVGKTYLAKKIATINSNKKDGLIHIDMSEFSEGHTLSRLIGAPAGYVGYEDSSFLFEKIKNNPTSVVLFDEVEKAHPKVLNILLQILEDGVLTDSRGKKCFFSNNIIILTTNAGNTQSGAGIGFSLASNKENEMRLILSQYINNEIINRIDSIIQFNRLNTKSMESISERELSILESRIQEFVDFSYTDKIIKYIANKSSKIEKGARGIRKVIQEDIEGQIANYIAKEDSIKSIKSDVKNNKLHFDVSSK